MHRVWRWGIDEQPPHRVRAVILVNLAALSGVVAAASYLVFFAVYAPRESGLLLLTQGLSIPCYMLVPWLNRRGHYTVALLHAALVAYANVFIITWLLSTAAGIYLYYLGVALIVPHLFPRLRGIYQAVLVLIPVALFVLCVILFDPATARIALPAPVQDGIFVFSAIGTAALILLLGFYMQAEIARAEMAAALLTERLTALSATDALSGLANRRALDEFLDQQWRQMARVGRPLAFLMCDIDHFKPYNDNYGHQAGDEALRRVADCLRQCAARPGDLVARYGGEEFAVVLSDTDSAGGLAVAEQIREAVMSARIVHGRGGAGPWLTVSIGLCTAVPDSGSEPAALIAAADEALYQAKQGGRNRVAARTLPGAIVVAVRQG